MLDVFCLSTVSEPYGDCRGEVNTSSTADSRALCSFIAPLSFIIVFVFTSVLAPFAETIAISELERSPLSLPDWVLGTLFFRSFFAGDLRLLFLTDLTADVATFNWLSLVGGAASISAEVWRSAGSKIGSFL